MGDALKDIMEMDINGEGNVLTYETKFLMDLGDTAQSMVDEQMKAQEPIMKSMVDAMKAAGIEDPVFKVVYLDKDGGEISSFVK